MHKTKINIKILLGNSTSNINHLTSTKDYLIYISGANIVFYDPILDTQLTYINYHTPNISSITVSQDQKFIAIAQSLPKNPVLTIYDITPIPNNPAHIVHYLRGHRLAIHSAKFSPNGAYLFSYSLLDGSMFLWCMKQGTEQTKNRVGRPLKTVLWDSHGDLLTAGHGYLKWWAFKEGQVIRKLEQQYWMLQGKTLGFGKKFSNKQFVDMKMYSQDSQNAKLLLLSADGLLCMIKAYSYDRIEKWIDLIMTGTTSIALYQHLLLCAGDNSLVKLIDMRTLTVYSKLPKPPPYYHQNITQDEQLHYSQNSQFGRCVGVFALAKFVLSLYDNRSIFIWQVEQEISAVRSFITHKARINSICLLDQLAEGSICFFSTVSDDNTIRIWHYYNSKESGHQESINLAEIIGIKRNVYCRNLTRIIYTSSQKPIIQTLLMKKKWLVCISQSEFIMYSLDDFTLVINQNFAQTYKILSLAVHNSHIYLGVNTGFVKIFTIGESYLKKIHQQQFGFPVYQLMVLDYDNQIILIGRDKLHLKLHSTSTSKDIINVYNIQCCTTTKQGHVIWVQNNTINIYSIRKNKIIDSISLGHELQCQEDIILVKTNGWLIVSLSSHFKVLIVNFSCVLLHSELLGGQIINLEITQLGQMIFVTQQGTILILELSDTQGYRKVQQQIKKWYANNDKSWMEGSIWASKKRQLKSNELNAHSKSITDIQQVGSQRYCSEIPKQQLKDQTPDLFELQLPNVNLQYKNKTNQMSVFNPSSIAEQLNQVYDDVKQVENRNKNKNIIKQKLTNQYNQLQLSESFDNIDIQTKDIKKRRIFQERESSNVIKSELSEVKLVKSLLKVNQDSFEKEDVKIEVPDDDSRLLNQEILTPRGNTNYFFPQNGTKTPLKSLLQILNDIVIKKEFIKQNSQQLQELYKILHKQFNKKYKQKEKEQIMSQFITNANNFLKYLQTKQ